MGVDIPDGARIVLFQEDKFKNYHNELHWALSEYDKVVSKVIPVTAMVLRPHFRYLDRKILFRNKIFRWLIHYYDQSYDPTLDLLFES